MTAALNRSICWQPAKPQACSRLEARRYRFESLDGSGFQVELPVDGDGVVLDYPELFRRVIN